MNCYFCDKELDGEWFCYGCEEYVCEECDKNPNLPFGSHHVTDHEDYDDDDD